MNQTYSNYEVIFVDAGSTDSSVDYVQKNYPEIIIIKCGRIGIGEAINIGIKNSSGEIISFDFNTDEYVLPNWLEELIKQLQKYDFDIITGTTRIIYGTNLIDEAGVKINYLGRGTKIGHKKEISKFSFTVEPVTHVGSPTFHRKILRKTGYIDEEYYIYVEDIDFCYRAKLFGYETYPAPLARSFHHISGTLGKKTERYEYFLKRAQIRFQIIHFDVVRMMISLFVICIFVPISSLIRAFLFFKDSKYYFKKFFANLKAIKWNIHNLKRTMSRRKEITYMRESVVHNSV